MTPELEVEAAGVTASGGGVGLMGQMPVGSTPLVELVLAQDITLVGESLQNPGLVHCHTECITSLYRRQSFWRKFKGQCAEIPPQCSPAIGCMPPPYISRPYLLACSVGEVGICF